CSRRVPARYRTRAIQVVVAFGAVGSAVWALSLRTGNPNHAYYGTDARAYELLAGALIALTPATVVWAKRYGRAMVGATLVGMAALVVLASDWFRWDAIQRGLAVTVVTTVLIVALEAASDGWIK